MVFQLSKLPKNILHSSKTVKATGSIKVDDIVIEDDFTFQLRAERSGKNKDGRIYLITYQVEDACGNTTFGFATVTVPFSQRNK